MLRTECCAGRLWYCAFAAALSFTALQMPPSPAQSIASPRLSRFGGSISPSWGTLNLRNTTCSRDGTSHIDLELNSNNNNNNPHDYHWVNLRIPPALDQALSRIQVPPKRIIRPSISQRLPLARAKTPCKMRSMCRTTVKKYTQQLTSPQPSYSA